MPIALVILGKKLTPYCTGISCLFGTYHSITWTNYDLLFIVNFAWVIRFDSKHSFSLHPHPRSHDSSTLYFTLLVELTRVESLKVLLHVDRHSNAKDNRHSQHHLVAGKPHVNVLHIADCYREYHREADKHHTGHYGFWQDGQNGTQFAKDAPKYEEQCSYLPHDTTAHLQHGQMYGY